MCRVGPTACGHAGRCNYVGGGTSKAISARFQSAADALFAVFALVWIPTRHGVLPLIYYSILTTAEAALSAHADCGGDGGLAYNPAMGCWMSAEMWAKILPVYKASATPRRTCPSQR